MSRVTRLEAAGKRERLFQAFAAVAHMTGCRSLFTFASDSDVVRDPRDLEFAASLFFHRVDSQERASFDPHFAGDINGELFALVGVSEEFDTQVVEDAIAWLAAERSCRVKKFRLPLDAIAEAL